MLSRLNKLNGWWRAWLVGTVCWLFYSCFQINAAVRTAELSANYANLRYASYGWKNRATPDYSDAYSWLWLGLGLPLTVIICAYLVRWVLQGFSNRRNT